MDACLEIVGNIPVLEEGIDILDFFPELAFGHVNVGDDVGDITDDETVNGRTHEHDDNDVKELNRIGRCDITVSNRCECSDRPVERLEIHRTVRCVFAAGGVLADTVNEDPSTGYKMARHKNPEYQDEKAHERGIDETEFPGPV